MNTPKLRFKEFNDEWIETKIQNVATVIGGGTPSTDEPKYWGNEINWFTPSEIGKTKYVTISNRKISQDGLKNSSAKLLPKGTILLSSRATVGEASILLNEASTNQGFQSLIVNENNCNEFIYYLKYKYKREMLIKSFGSTFLEISKSNVENIKIKIPSKEEQLKVAKFLSLLDKKIELQSKKIEDLKLFKLCINNILFNGNKTVKLKDICECKSSTISLSDIEYDDGIYPIYGANGEIKKINSYQNDKDYLAIIKDGAGVGKTIICNKKSSIIATLSALIPNGIPVYYFNELINKIDFSKYIVGSGIPHIYFKDYSNEKLYLHEEKKRILINNLFKKIIIKIELEENKLHLLETLKKGLMQNMFV